MGSFFDAYCICVRPIPLSYVGRMRQSYGIPCVPLYRPILCVHPIPLSYMYVGQMGQSYGIPCVPLYRPILCVRPIPLSYMGRMGQSYGIPCVPLYRPILCVRPIPLSYVTVHARRGLIRLINCTVVHMGFHRTVPSVPCRTVG